jgi:hypothetical protein
LIRVESIWMAVQPLDMRAGTEAALARVVLVSAQLARTMRTSSPIGVPTA